MHNFILPLIYKIFSNSFEVHHNTLHFTPFFSSMNHVIKRYIFWIPFCFVALLNHQGSDQIITDRPDQTESYSTIDKGALQIEAGFQIGFEGDHSIAIQQFLAPTTLFRQGISGRCELKILSQTEQIRF